METQQCKSVTVNGVQLDEFTKAYVDCALWSSTDSRPESNDEPMDAQHDVTDIHPDTLRKMADDCNAFRALTAPSGDHVANGAMRVREWLEMLPCHVRSAAFTDDEMDGHDFWLTRNRHGAGFWDRGYGKIGDIVSDAAKTFGSFDLYVGDDGMIYD